MVNLPKSCLVDKFIPKGKFYEKSNINSRLKNEFIDKIKRITWKYKLSEESIGVVKDKDIIEVEIFEIELKNMEIPKNVLEIIDKSIPYMILYKFMYRDNFCYGIALKKGKKVDKYYFSNWNEEINFEFNGKDLKVVYQNIVKKFIKREIDFSLDFEKIIEIDNKMARIEKEILILENKMKKEKQFKRKAELHKQIKELNNEIEKIRLG